MAKNADLSWNICLRPLPPSVTKTSFPLQYGLPSSLFLPVWAYWISILRHIPTSSRPELHLHLQQAAMRRIPKKNKPVIKPVYVFLQILNFLKITSVILNCNNCNCFSILINTKNSNIIIYDKLPISFFSITSLQTPLMRLRKCIQLQNRRF